MRPNLGKKRKVSPRHVDLKANQKKKKKRSAKMPKKEKKLSPPTSEKGGKKRARNLGRSHIGKKKKDLYEMEKGEGVPFTERVLVSDQPKGKSKKEKKEGKPA